MIRLQFLPRSSAIKERNKVQTIVPTICHCYIFKMSTSENIMDSLSIENKKKFLALMKKFQEYKSEKEKYQSLYRDSVLENDQLKLQIEKTQAENRYLKEQMHSSFSVISKVRKNFQQIKKNGSAGKKKAQANQCEWEDEEIQDAQNRINPSNLKTKNWTFEKNNFQKALPPPMASAKKSLVLNSSSQIDLNQTSMSSSKKLQMIELKKEIRIITEQLKVKEKKDVTSSEKYKKYQEIKNRYKQKDSEKQIQNQSDHEKSLNDSQSESRSAICRLQREKIAGLHNLQLQGQKLHFTHFNQKAAKKASLLSPAIDSSKKNERSRNQPASYRQVSSEYNADLLDLIESCSDL